MFTKLGTVCSIFFCLMICMTSCSAASHNISHSETTIAGDIAENYLDGNAEVETFGTPFTEKEILMQIDAEIKTGVIDTNCQISNIGYYHINIKNNYLDYNFLTLPIVKKGQLCGEMALQRKEDGTIETAMVSFYNENNKLSELLESNPGKKFAMVYAEMSEYAIMEDNTVYTISGFSPKINNDQNLYNAYNLKDNIFSCDVIT